MPGHHLRKQQIAIVGLVLAVISGCSNNDLKLASVRGRVTLDGQPVAGVLVTFKPRELKGTTSYGLTNASGEYRLMSTRTSVGAYPGEYEINITAASESSNSERDELIATGETPPAERSDIPARYQQAGLLTATVKPGSNTIDFPLTRN
jgi:hypothetical protein